MRKVFLLVLMGLLLILSVSCKSKNERILEEVKKGALSELSYKKDILTRYCVDRSSLTKNEAENTEKCKKIMLDTEEEYNKKFLSLLDFYSDNKMNMGEIQELYNKTEEDKLKEAWSRIGTLTSNMVDSDDVNGVVTYKKTSIISLAAIDISEKSGFYASKIEEIKNNDDVKWQKDTAEELQIRSSVIMEKERIPEFSDPEVWKLAEKYLEYVETCKVYAIYEEKERFLDYHEKAFGEIQEKLESLSLNMSDEDEKKLFNYMGEKKKEADGLFTK